MFFLLRIGFWLTIVALLLPAFTGGSSSPGPAGGETAKVSTMDALSAATSAMADAGGFCTRQPQACEIGAGLIEVIGEKVQAGAQFALGYISQQIIEEKRKAAIRATGSPAGDTLTTHDLNPGWQGPSRPEAAADSHAATPTPRQSLPAAIPAVPAVPLPPRRPA